MNEIRKDLTAEEQGEVLGAFSKALQREMHKYILHLDLLKYQHHNRLDRRLRILI
jgi:hypothetical protein